MDSGDESDAEPISTEMLEYVCDRSQSRMNVNRREAFYKVLDCIKQRQLEWKGALKATQNMDKGLHKMFKTVENIYFKLYHLWENLVQKFPISFQNLETFLKLQNYQMK